MTEAVFHHLVHIDPEKRMRERYRQHVQLARYGRQSMLDWDSVEINEMERYYAALVEVMDGEREIEAVEETHG